jgi:hypothetical protein
MRRRKYEVHRHKFAWDANLADKIGFTYPHAEECQKKCNDIDEAIAVITGQPRLEVHND